VLLPLKCVLFVSNFTRSPGPSRDQAPKRVIDDVKGLLHATKSVLVAQNCASLDRQTVVTDCELEK